MSRPGDKDQRQSSLPSSLIPLLYTAPQDQSADSEQAPDHPDSPPYVLRPINPPPEDIPPHTQRSGHPLGIPPPVPLQPGPPVRSDPRFYVSPVRQRVGAATPLEPLPIRAPERHLPSIWRENEPRQSSMHQPLFPRPASTPTRLPVRQHPELPSIHSLDRHIPDRYPSEHGGPYGTPPRPRPFPETRQYPEFTEGSSSGPVGRPMDYPSRQPPAVRPDFPLPPLTVPNPHREWLPPGDLLSTGRSSSRSSDYPPSTAASTTFGSTDAGDEETEPTAARRKRDALDNLDEPAPAAPAPKPRAAKKTPIACDFCRGRKLRCDGTRPACWNCISRGNQNCVYQAQPRRRGPGKAPRGKKRPTTTSSRGGSASASSVKPEDPPEPKLEFDELDQDHEMSTPEPGPSSQPLSRMYLGQESRPVSSVHRSRKRRSDSPQDPPGFTPKKEEPQ